ncbi:carbon-nitrogen hydrolase [Xylariaceae sp. FL0255]|nr:carbon-nitrogen hydrolase [Xylariaceae sp. FL0255]
MSPTAVDSHPTEPPASGFIRLATASPATQRTKEETLAQLERLARDASRRYKADFLLLPEAYLGGYPRGSDFGCKVGARTAEGYVQYAEYFRGAVDLGDTVSGGAGGLESWVAKGKGEKKGKVSDGVEDEVSKTGTGDGTREELERIARGTGVFIVVGLVERAGGSLYCAVVYVCPRRGIIGKRRKVMPTGTERLIWAQGSPATLKAVSTTIRGTRVNLAAAICWENYMPLLRQSLYAQNINLYFAPTADGRDTWLPLMRTAAVEGRCFVISSNMCVREDAQQAATIASSSGLPVRSASEHETEMDDGHPRQNGAGGRRNSCMTEEGFEIALPSQSKSSSPVTSSRVRRRSVFDEDGHEIVLPCGNANPLTSSAAVVEESNDNNEEEGIAHAATPSSAAPREEGPAPVTTTTALETVLPHLSGGFPTQKTETAPAPAAINEAKEKEQERPKFASRGGSSIVSPFGEVLAGPQWEDDSGIIYADVDFTECVRGRLDLDVAGSYSRNDAFKLSVEGLDLDPLPYF